MSEIDILKLERDAFLEIAKTKTQGNCYYCYFDYYCEDENPKCNICGAAWDCPCNTCKLGSNWKFDKEKAVKRYMEMKEE